MLIGDPLSLSKLADSLGRDALALRLIRALLISQKKKAADIQPAIDKAGDFNEVVSAVDATFKGSSKEVKDWAAGYSKAVGRTKGQTLDFARSFKGLLKGMKVGDKLSTDMAKSMTELAFDAGSFLNVSDEIARSALLSGLAGEQSDVLKKAGVNTKVENVNKRLKSQGIDPKKASEAQKVGARLAIIMEALADAQGDVVRTNASYNNQIKALNAAYQEFAVALGTAVMPALAGFVGGVKEIILAAKEYVSTNPEVIGQIVETIAKVTMATAAVGGLAVAIKVVIALFAALSSPLGLAVGLIATLTAGVMTFTNTWGAAGNFIMETFESVFGFFKQVFGGMLTALQGGDIALAAEIGMLGLKMVWVKSLNFLLAGWDNMTTGIIGAFDWVISTVSKALTDFIAWSLRGLARVVGALSRVSSWAKKISQNINSAAKSVEDFGQRTRKGLERRQGQRQAYLDREAKMRQGNEDAISKDLEKLTLKAEAKKETKSLAQTMKADKMMFEQKKKMAMNIEGLFKEVQTAPGSEGPANVATTSSSAVALGLVGRAASPQEKQLTAMKNLVNVGGQLLNSLQAMQAKLGLA